MRFIGIRFVGINCNSVNAHPHDSLEDMVKKMEENEFSWACVCDQPQDTAGLMGHCKHRSLLCLATTADWSIPDEGEDDFLDTSQENNNDLERALDEILAG